MRPIQSTADFGVIAAFVPFVLMIITVVIAVIVAFARFGDHAGGRHRNQPEQEAAFDYLFCTCHEASRIIVP
jgi:hypothetical protein